MDILIGGGVRDIQDLLILRGTLSGDDLVSLSGEVYHGLAQAGSG